MSDPSCKPYVFLLSQGQAADIAVGPSVLALAPPMKALLADRGYDGDDFRAEIVERGAKPSFPTNPTE